MWGWIRTGTGSPFSTNLSHFGSGRTPSLPLRYYSLSAHPIGLPHLTAPFQALLREQGLRFQGDAACTALPRNHLFDIFLLGFSGCRRDKGAWAPSFPTFDAMADNSFKSPGEDAPGNLAVENTRLDRQGRSQALHRPGHRLPDAKRIDEAAKTYGEAKKAATLAEEKREPGAGERPKAVSGKAT